MNQRSRIASIEAVGFDPRDVKILINNHAHFDHAGGLGAVKAATGAKLFASAADAKQMSDSGRDDYGLFDTGLFPPVVADSILANGVTVALGGWRLKAVVTPGHTRGCTNWTTTIETGGEPLGAVFMCSASVPGYKLVGNKGYPNIIADYEKVFPALRGLRCDYFFGSHPSFFRLTEKAAKLRANPNGANPFVDPAGCRRWIDDNDNAFRDQVARERAAVKAARRSRE
jgi:metallo-beta-lactamase class B